MKKVVNDQRWNKPLVHEDPQFILPDSPRLYSELLAQNLHRFIEKAKNAFFTKWYVVRGLSESIARRDGVTIEHYFGNMAGDIEYRILVEKIMDDTKKQAAYVNKLQNQQEMPKPQQTEIPKGFGTYFFPPIVIGKIQRPSPSDILDGWTNIGFPTFDKKAFDIQFIQIPIIITKDGYVGVGSNSKEKALEILNTIMAVFTLDGMEAYAVREHELSQMDYNSETLNITGYSYDMNTIRNQLFLEAYGNKVLEHRVKEVSEDQIKKIMKNAAKIFENESLAEELRIFLESITHLKGNEFSQAFLMGWIIIERHISQLWDYYLKEKKFDKKRAEKLQNVGQWSTDQWIEVLNIIGHIEDTNYSVYMNLKRKRNDLMHYGEKIDKESAEKCVNIAKEIILKKNF